MNTIFQAIGLATLFSTACYPIFATDWAREQHAKAVAINKAAQVCGTEFRKAQRHCAQQE